MTTLKREGKGGTFYEELPPVCPPSGYPLRTPVQEVHLVSGECIEDIECHCCNPPLDRRTWWQRLSRAPYLGHRTELWGNSRFKIWEAVEV